MKSNQTERDLRETCEREERRKKKNTRTKEKKVGAPRYPFLISLSLSVCVCVFLRACVKYIAGVVPGLCLRIFFFLKKAPPSLSSTGSTHGTGKERALSSFFGRILFFFARNIIIVSPLRRGLFFGEEGISNGCSSFLLKYILRAGEEKKDILLLLLQNNNNNNNKQQRFLYSYAKSASSYYKHI